MTDYTLTARPAIYGDLRTLVNMLEVAGVDFELELFEEKGGVYRHILLINAHLAEPVTEMIFDAKEWNLLTVRAYE